MNKQSDPVEKLSQAYDAMMERVHDKLNDSGKNSVPALKEALALAREKAVELGELSREEAEKLAGYVERDAHDAADFIVETGQEFKDWLAFDWKLVERRLFDALAGVADKTSVQLQMLAEQARAVSTYHAGEIIGPGSLVCKRCGEVMHFEHSHAIPPCPECNASEFSRWRKNT